MNDVLNCTQEVTSFFLLSVMTFSHSNTSNSQTRLIVTAAKNRKGEKPLRLKIHAAPSGLNSLLYFICVWRLCLSPAQAAPPCFYDDGCFPSFLKSEPGAGEL